MWSGIDRGQSSIFVLCFMRSCLRLFYMASVQRTNILDKAKTPSLYSAQINIFVNTAAIWRCGEESEVLQKPGKRGSKSHTSNVSSKNKLFKK